ASSAYTPNPPPVRQIYFQVDTCSKTWQRASPQGSTGSGTTPPLGRGLHIIYAFAVDGQETSSITGLGDSIPGQISDYHFLVPAPTSVRIDNSPTTSFMGQPVSLTATVTGPGNIPVTGGTVQFKDNDVDFGDPVFVSGGTAVLNTISLAVGSHRITCSFSGDTTFVPAVAHTTHHTVTAAAC